MQALKIERVQPITGAICFARVLLRGLPSDATYCQLWAVAFPSPFHRLALEICLHFTRNRVIHVVTAVITAEGDNMNTSIAEEARTAQATATGEQPKPTKRPASRDGAPTCPKKAKSARKASPPKKATKGRKKANPPARQQDRRGSRLLQRKDGTTLKELLKLTAGGRFSAGIHGGTVGKKMSLPCRPQRPRRRAPLLDQSLRPVLPDILAPPGPRLEVFLDWSMRSSAAQSASAKHKQAMSGYRVWLWFAPGSRFGRPRHRLSPQPSILRGEGLHLWPQVLPGGRFLVFVESHEPENAGVYVASSRDTQ